MRDVLLDLGLIAAVIALVVIVAAQFV